jgi:hypothetical protein
MDIALRAAGIYRRMEELKPMVSAIISLSHYSLCARDLLLDLYRQDSITDKGEGSSASSGLPHQAAKSRSRGRQQVRR